MCIEVFADLLYVHVNLLAHRLLLMFALISETTDCANVCR